MTLIDTGPLVALHDRSDKWHDVCAEAIRGLNAPLTTTWSVLTEAMHLLGHRGGWESQAALWGLVLDETVVLGAMHDTPARRCHDLMRKYADAPMDLADASLVAVPEANNDGQIFTLDSHFHIFRMHGRRAFNVIPILPHR